MRGGIIQIHITRACDQACFHCTQGSNLGGKPVIMSLDEFEQACNSVRDYWGVIGIFGGNPTMHPKFDVICDIMKGYIPWPQRGLWCNNLRGHGAKCRQTFNPSVSNLNVHLDKAAYEEFRRDWPEAVMVKGQDEDSIHSSPWVAMSDLDELPFPDGSRRDNTEANRFELIGKCDINQFWSAIYGVVPGRGLRFFFCEIAYAQAALHADNPNWRGTGKPMPDTGLEAMPGVWREAVESFENQIRTHCHACGIPLNRKGQKAIGGEREEFTKTHEWIARPKVRDRPVHIMGGNENAGPLVPLVVNYLPDTHRARGHA